MTMHEHHIAMVEAVNNAKTEHEHREADLRLEGFRRCLEAFDEYRGFPCSWLIKADLHYLDTGVDRPMCCGVFLDWKPTAEEPTP